MPSVLITGSNRGIGLELLRQYAAAGWEVIGTCRDPAAADAAAAVAAQHPGVTLRALEVTDAAAGHALAAELRGRAIDVLILNAGVMGASSKDLGAIDADDFRRVLDVNVVAATICAEAFRGHVADSGRRIIVGMGSILGSIGSNGDGRLYSYRASKAALHAVMRSLSIDLRDEGVIAIAMHPGWVRTDMGGPDAALAVTESAAGMMRVINGLRPADSGRFLGYDGAELPW